MDRPDDEVTSETPLDVEGGREEPPSPEDWDSKSREELVRAVKYLRKKERSASEGEKRYRLGLREKERRIAELEAISGDNPPPDKALVLLDKVADIAVGGPTVIAKHVRDLLPFATVADDGAITIDTTEGPKSVAEVLGPDLIRARGGPGSGGRPPIPLPNSRPTTGAHSAVTSQRAFEKLSAKERQAVVERGGRK